MDLGERPVAALPQQIPVASVADDTCVLHFSLDVDNTQEQPIGGDVTIEAFGATLSASYPEIAFDTVRTATPLDDPPFEFHADTTYRFQWSNPDDVAQGSPPDVLWATQMFPGSEIPRKQWSATGTLAGTDEIAFTAGLNDDQVRRDGVVVITVGGSEGDATSCSGADACTYHAAHQASHAARSEP
jgi:hypothetical protein